MINNKILGRVYKIVSDSTDLIYIGSTVRFLSNRMSYHRSDYKRYLDGKGKYTSSYEILQYGDARIELIQEGLFDDIKSLRRLEGQIIKNSSNIVNKNIAGRDTKTYEKENYDKIKERRDKYYDDNKKKEIKRALNYYYENIEKYKEYQIEYRKNNRDKIKQLNKARYNRIKNVKIHNTDNENNN